MAVRERMTALAMKALKRKLDWRRPIRLVVAMMKNNPRKTVLAAEEIKELRKTAVGPKLETIVATVRRTIGPVKGVMVTRRDLVMNVLIIQTMAPRLEAMARRATLFRSKRLATSGLKMMGRRRTVAKVIQNTSLLKFCVRTLWVWCLVEAMCLFETGCLAVVKRGDEFNEYTFA